MTAITRAIWLVVIPALLVGALTSYAQLPTGDIAGRVINDGQPLPGVSVTSTSPNLQGSRTTATSLNGDYFFPSLPPGEYTIRMELSGFRPYQEKLRLGASQSATVNASMILEAVEAAMVVTGRSEQVSTGTQAAATYTAETLDKLPVARTILAAVALAPGVNQNGPNGFVTISGAQSYENLYMVNGATIVDNLQGQPRDLFIEDAIQETTTITSSVSAEFGRFTGGVVNTITKSGGNTFSGSFRTTLTNDDWSAVTPYGETKTDKTVPAYEATLGGPFWKDRIWFFGAFRGRDNTTSNSLAPPTAIPVVQTDDERRYEVKLTLTPFTNQRLTGSYLRIDRGLGNWFYGNGLVPTLDLASVYDMQRPQELWVANYNGLLTESFFLEGQYSNRKNSFVNGGSQYTDLVKGTVLYSFDPPGYYNAPFFCAVCSGATEKLDNEQFFAKVSHFFSTKSLGSHNVVLGYDNFKGSHFSNHYVSGSSYFINGSSVIYKNGDLFPVFDSGTYLGFYPVLNASQPTSVRTQSVFLNDTWKLNEHLTMNLGVRFDKNHGEDQGGIVTAQDSNFSPRLAIAFDPTGQGNLRFGATYAKYVGAISELHVISGSGVGATTYLSYDYGGPPINTNPNGPLLTREQAIRAVFDWFGITAPGQFPRKGIDPFYASIPGIDTVIRESLKSPYANEVTVGVGGSIGRRATFRVDGVYRKYGDFYVIRRDLSTGQVTESQFTGQTFDLGVVQNADAPLKRLYWGLHTNFSWRPWDSVNMGGSWTWSHTYGNLVGEDPGSGAIQDRLFTYPEYRDIRWYSPTGDLPQDQRHRVRLFGTWETPIPKALGRLSIGLLQSIDTGVPYGAAGMVKSSLYVTNPGYATPPSSVTYWYTARDAFRAPTAYRTDLALTYGFNIGPVQLFVQPQVLNLFNGQAIVSTQPGFFNQTVDTAVNQPRSYVGFNPFTTVPVQGPPGSGANWNTSADFGRALSPRAYQPPRTFRISMGLSF